MMLNSYSSSRGQGLKYKRIFLSKMAKCEICNGKIDETFLHKILGTYVKDSKGKKHAICYKCQKIFGDKENLIKNLK